MQAGGGAGCAHTLIALRRSHVHRRSSQLLILPGLVAGFGERIIQTGSRPWPAAAKNALSQVGIQACDANSCRRAEKMTLAATVCIVE